MLPKDAQVMPYDAEGRFIYPLPPRKPKAKAKTPTKVEQAAKKQPQPPPKTEPTILPFSKPKEAPVAPVQTRPTKAPALASFSSPPSELDLAMLWNAQIWPSGLRLNTVEGLPVEIIYRGRWSGGFGPDFKGAILEIGGELRRGDVELHLKTSGWQAHGHQRDPRYNEVILQVVLENDTNSPGITRNGVHPALLALLPLFESAETLAELILTAYTKGTRLGSISESEGLCCDRVSQNYTDLDQLLQKIDEVGEQRFTDRATYYEAEAAANPENGVVQAFWAGLLEATGYSQNKKPFRKLAEVLPLTTILELEQAGRRRHEPFDERVLTLETALLGAAGLLPSQRHSPKLPNNSLSLFGDEPAGLSEPEPLEDWAAGVYVEELERRWNWLEREIRATSDFSPLPQSSWTFARLRPANHPARRIAGLARWLARLPISNESDLLDWLAGKLANETALENCWVLDKTFLVGLDDRASESGQFWARRFDFVPRALMVGEEAKGATVDLIGPDRAADIVVNIVLPCLYGYARDQGNRTLEARVLAAYRAHPKLGSNELVENVARQVFRFWLEQPGEVILNGKPLKKLTAGRLIDSACRQQGLIHLHHQFCASQDYVNCPLRLGS